MDPLVKLMGLIDIIAGFAILLGEFHILLDIVAILLVGKGFVSLMS